jgi:hypothetical protein
VGAVVDDAASLEVDDVVGEDDRRHPVGDHQHGGPRAGVAQPGQDRLLHRRVDVARRVVEDQELGAPNHGTCQGDSLPLTAREARAPLPHPRVEPHLQGPDEARCLRGAEGLPDLVVAEVGAEGDVAAHRVVEQEGLLGHEHPDGRDAAARHLSHVDLVDGDRAAVGVDETQREIRQCRLARAGGPDQSRRGAGRHLDGDGVDRLVLREVALLVDHVIEVVDAAEVRSRGPLLRDALLAVGHLAHGLEHRAHALPADHGARQLAQHPAERAHREGEDGDQVGDLDDLRRREVARGHALRAHGEHQQGPQGGDGLDHGVERPPGAAHLDVGVPEAVGDAGEALRLLCLAAHGLDHHPGLEALVRDLRDLGPQLLGAGHAWGHVALEDHVGEEECREDRQPDDRHDAVDEDHLHDPGDEHDDDPEGHGQRREDVPGGLDVGIRVREQLARGVAVVPRERQPEVLPGHLAAEVRADVVHGQTRGDAPGDDPDHVQHHHRGHPAADGQQLRRRRVAGLHGRGDVLVGDPPDDPRRSHRHHAVERAAHHRQGEPPGLATDADADDGQAPPQGGRSGSGHRGSWEVVR